MAVTGNNPKHTCHASGCAREIPPRLFVCAQHWRLVPKILQRGVWRHYRPGQEVDKRPTPEYLEAARKAIDAVRRVQEEATS